MRPFLRGKYLDKRLRHFPKDAVDNHIRCLECGGGGGPGRRRRSRRTAATSSHRPAAVATIAYWAGSHDQLYHTFW